MTRRSPGLAMADKASAKNTNQVSPRNLVCGTRILGLLTAIYLALGTLYALCTPLWQVPDEPAHFNYVKYLAEEKQLPVLRDGDYPAAYLEEIKARQFPAEMSVDSLRYEFWQPPLYYSLAALVYMAAKPWALVSQVLALRLLSVLFGAGLLWVAYRIVREIFPDNDVLALSTAAFAAAVPMHVAMTAATNNDTLAELILSAILLCCIRLAKQGIRPLSKLASCHSERSEESLTSAARFFSLRLQNDKAGKARHSERSEESRPCRGETLPFAQGDTLPLEAGVSPAFRPGKTVGYKPTASEKNDNAMKARHSERSEESRPCRGETLRFAQGDIRRVPLEAGVSPAFRPGKTVGYKPTASEKGCCFPDRLLIVLGVLMGLGLLTKSTTAISVAPALLSLWFALRRSRPQEWMKALFLVFGPAVAISGGWFLRNARTYGWDDPLIWKRHAEVVVGQLTTAEYVAEHGWGVWLHEFLCTTFHSFWAQFGWMGVPIDQRLYLLLFFLSGFVILGLALFVVKQWRGWRLNTLSPARVSRQQWRMLAILALAMGLTAASYLWYNRRFVQFQGRYLFPAIVPLGLAFALGLAEILSRGYEAWLAALAGGGAFLLVLKGLATGDLAKLPLALWAGSALGFLGKRALPPRYDKWFVALVYATLLALTAASPSLFILPYL